MDQQVAPIPVFRPPFLTDGGEFRGSLIEAPANIFYQQVKASRATLNRMQFQWRSVSDSLLLSPTVRLRFQLKITCPQMWTQLLSYVGFRNHAACESRCEPVHGRYRRGSSFSGTPPRVRRRRRVYQLLQFDESGV